MRVLLVEDVEDDALLVLQELRRGGFEISFERIETREALRAALGRQAWDMILADYRLPAFTGVEALEELKATGKDIPFILISATIGEETAVSAMKAGAHDYVMKDKLARLVPVVKRELREVEVRRQHRLAEDALRESEANYRRIVEMAHEGIWTVNAQFQITFVNQRMAELFGYQIEEMIGQPAAFLMFEEDQPHFQRHMEEHLLHGKRERHEWRFRCKQGKTLWALFSATPIFNDKGSFLGSAGVFTDLTERKMAEEERERLALVIEQATETVIITDPKANILYVNPAFERITGYTRAEVMGRNPRLLQSGKHDAAFYQEIWNTLKRGETWSGHFINKRKDGSFYEEEATLTPVRAPSGEVVNYVAVNRDVTKELLLQGQLMQAQKMEVVGRLAGGVAHDFNNLLMVMGGYAGLLMKRLPGTSPHRRMVAEILKTAERGASLTRQLLMFSHKQLGKPQVISLNEVIAENEKILRQILGDDGKLVKQCEDDLVPVLADPARIQQVLMNLVVNARDAMPHGGTVTLRTANVHLSRMDPELFPGTPAGDYVKLEVADTGCGMDPKIQSHLFEPFFTTKEKGKGTGLGLSIVYGIIEQARGRIFVRSQPNQGATFTILLPQCQESLPNLAQAVCGKPLTKGEETILLAEDDPHVRKITVEILKSNGYHVIAAREGREALMQCRKHRGRIHLLLTDMVMPGMNGLDLAREITRLRPETKVVLMSAYSDEKIMKRVFAENHLFIPKPTSPEALLAKLREILDQE